MAVTTEPVSTTQPDQASSEKHHTPASALLAARLGGAIALAAAASLSFGALCDLAHHAGLHHLAALLSIAVDAFAASALFVSYRLPAGHTAHRAASRTARLALAVTVACNGLDHLLDLAGYLLTKHVRDLLLVAVASLPPLIVERLLHLQTALVAGSSDAKIASAAGQQRPGTSARSPEGTRFFASLRSATHSEASPNALDIAADAAGDEAALTDHLAVHQRGHNGQTGHARVDSKGRSAERPAEERWLSIAAPVYRALAARTGRRPTESAFHAALTAAVTDGHDRGFEEAGGSRAVAPMSLSTAKRIRALVEGNDFGTPD